MQRSLRPLQGLWEGIATQRPPRASLPWARLSRATSSRQLPLRPVVRQLYQPTPFSRHLARHNSNLAAPESTNSNPSVPKHGPRPDQPSYKLTFTCTPCNHRSAHRISKQGYHRGTVLIQCPSCKNRHVISDHLKIFMDEASTLEDILMRQGALVKKGKLGIRQGKSIGNEGEEDIEFWEDGSETPHQNTEI